MSTVLMSSRLPAGKNWFVVLHPAERFLILFQFFYGLLA